MSWPPDPKAVEPVFFAVWIVLIFASLIFWRMASPTTKKKWQTPSSAAAGLIFLVFVALMSGKQGFFFALPFVIAITWINAKLVRVCPRCGAIARSTTLYPPAKFCPSCGTSLDTSASG